MCRVKQYFADSAMIVVNFNASLRTPLLLPYKLGHIHKQSQYRYTPVEEGWRSRVLGHLDMVLMQHTVALLLQCYDGLGCIPVDSPWGSAARGWIPGIPDDLSMASV